MDIFEQMIRASGANPYTVTPERILQIARIHAGRAMASIKLNKDWKSVTADEIWETLENPETPHNEDLTGKTLREGENAYQWFLAGCDFYDKRFARRRIDTNHDLDKGEITAMSKRWPTRERQAGRPSRSKHFRNMLARDVHFRLAAGEASSIEKVVEKITARRRNGDVIPGSQPLLVMPQGQTSHFTIHKMLRDAARDEPGLIEEAQKEGLIVRGGSEPDAKFMGELLRARAIMTNGDAVELMLKAYRRKNRNK